MRLEAVHKEAVAHTTTYSLPTFLAVVQLSLTALQISVNVIPYRPRLDRTEILEQV